MKKRLIVTGAGGFVAGSIIRQAGPEWELHAFSGNEAMLRRDHLVWHQFEVTRFDETRRIFMDIRPDAVIHAAAIANIDTCENQKTLARQVNVDLTRELAGLCRECSTRMVYVSTDNVFDGEKGDYCETDPTRPINYYAETKIAAESVVMETVSDSVVVRLALVVGLPLLGVGNTFLPKTLDMLAREEQIRVVVEEVRTPVDVITAGRALLELAGNDVRGPLHLSGSEALNRLDLTQSIATAFGYSKDLVVATDIRSLVGRTPRPRDVSLNNANARRLLKTPMLKFDAALQRIRTGIKNG